MPAVASPFFLGFAASAAIGIAAGLGGYTFYYANGHAYLSNDPTSCTNCHIMQDVYNGWSRSTHRSVAVCNDCHTPYGFVTKYFTKVINGFQHSKAFTTGEFHEPIQITEKNRAITEEQCRGCHREMVATIQGSYGQGDGLSCIRCHRSVGHLH